MVRFKGEETPCAERLESTTGESGTDNTLNKWCSVTGVWEKSLLTAHLGRSGRLGRERRRRAIQGVQPRDGKSSQTVMRPELGGREEKFEKMPA